MEKRRKGSSPDSFRNDQAQTEEMIACSIMELICSFGTVIKKEKQLDVLKTKFNVDWIDIVEKVSFAREFHPILKLLLPHHIDTHLETTCRPLYLHLLTILQGSLIRVRKPPNI